MDRKICLAGFATPSKFWALYQPEDVEIWCMNEGHIFLNRINIVFQVHPRDWREQAKKDSGQDSKIPPNTFARGEGHVQFLQGCPVPVIMQQKFDDIPNCHVFPYEEVYAKYGHYLTSTPAMMLALALLLDDRARAGQTEMLCGMVPRILTEVRISGVELRVGSEYYKERACFEYYLGRAIERGARFVEPPMGTSILNAPTYALEEAPTMPSLFKGEPIKVLVNVTKDGELRDAGTRTKDKAVEDRGGGDAPPDQRAAGGVADGGGDKTA
jgi:hypothetical protein